MNTLQTCLKSTESPNWSSLIETEKTTYRTGHVERMLVLASGFELNGTEESQKHSDNDKHRDNALKIVTFHRITEKKIKKKSREIISCLTFRG